MGNEIFFFIFDGNPNQHQKFMFGGNPNQHR